MTSNDDFAVHYTTSTALHLTLFEDNRKVSQITAVLTWLNFEDFDSNWMVVMICKVKDIWIPEGLLEQGHLTIGVLPGPEIV